MQAVMAVQSLILLRSRSLGKSAARQCISMLPPQVYDDWVMQNFVNRAKEPQAMATPIADSFHLRDGEEPNAAFSPFDKPAPGRRAPAGAPQAVESCVTAAQWGMTKLSPQTTAVETADDHERAKAQAAIINMYNAPAPTPQPQQWTTQDELRQAFIEPSWAEYLEIARDSADKRGFFSTFDPAAKRKPGEPGFDTAVRDMLRSIRVAGAIDPAPMQVKPEVEPPAFIDEDNPRRVALQMAVDSALAGDTAEQTVETAQVFLAFMTGAG